tara:strand:+ start:1827 stop:2150 length:324 start_codon:yes stop_codon:yes gene_type:complete
MATTYKWEIGELKCIPKVGSKVNVVKAIPYNYIGTADDSDNTQGIISGSVSIQTSDLSNWTAYASLSKSDVEGWLEANLTVNDLKTEVDTIIANKQNPQSVFVNVPW